MNWNPCENEWKRKRSSIATIPTNESIEQAMQLQSILNSRLEEMLTENDLLKKSIQELESYAQQQQEQTCKSIKDIDIQSSVVLSRTRANKAHCLN